MFELEYLQLVDKVINYGVTKELQYGDTKIEDVYCISLFGESLRININDGFPLLTTRKVNWKAAILELLWFIGGTADVVQLHKSGCKFWDDWAAKEQGISLKQFKNDIKEGRTARHILPLSYTNHTEWQVDKWGYIDQTQWVLKTLRKNPNARHCVVSYWNPTEIYEMADWCENTSTVLPPCVWSYQILINDGCVDMIVNQRSADGCVGVPNNILQYAALLMMYAHCLELDCGRLQFNYGDLHIYSNHIETFNIQINNQILPSPWLHIKDHGQEFLQDFKIEDFEVLGYEHGKFLKYPITVVGGY